MIIAVIMVSLTALKRPNLFYISSTQSARTYKENAFLYFQFEDFKAFQLFKFHWPKIPNYWTQKG